MREPRTSTGSATIDVTVSVIVTTKNNESSLEVCLKSIARQSYRHLELIVVDNKSTDKTKKIAAEYTPHIYDKGPERSAQRNFGVKKAIGSYIFIIDSDMELPETVVEECLKVISQNTNAVIIPEMSYGQGYWAQCKALERSFYNGVDAIEAPRFFSKTVYQTAGGYDEDMAGGEDWDLGSRIRKLTNIARTTTPIRHNEGHLTLAQVWSKRRYYKKGFQTYYAKANVKTHSTSTAKQVLDVYALFFNNPTKLFRNPFTGIGMLFLKTLEFAALAI